MVKCFCDVCGTEVKTRDYVSERYCPKLGKVKCEVVVSINKVCNSGNICLKCLREVLQRGDE